VYIRKGNKHIKEKKKNGSCVSPKADRRLERITVDLKQNSSFQRRNFAKMGRAV
jgi:hypothetical protein